MREGRDIIYGKNTLRKMTKVRGARGTRIGERERERDWEESLNGISKTKEEAI